MATESLETVTERLATATPRAVDGVRKATRRKVAGSTKRRKKPEVNQEEERILRDATIHLIRKHGGLLVATGLREEELQGAKSWVITVTLRYPTGFEGYIGDLRYDGEDFEFLTPADVRKERARQIADDPERIRLWNEYRASTLPAGKK